MGRKKQENKMLLKTFLISKEEFDELVFVVNELNLIYGKKKLKLTDNSKCIRKAIKSFSGKMKAYIQQSKEGNDEKQFT